MMARRLMLCAAALLAAGCTHVVGGTAVPGYGAGPNLSGVDVNRVLLEQSRMQAITGGGEHLTIIPSMDGDSPVDIDALAPSAPPECRFVFADSATFGPDIETFHKTTFQDPPHGGLISEGAAAYRDADTARHAFSRSGGNRWPLRGQLCAVRGSSVPGSPTNSRCRPAPATAGATICSSPWC